MISFMGDNHQDKRDRLADFKMQGRLIISYFSWVRCDSCHMTAQSMRRKGWNVTGQ